MTTPSTHPENQPDSDFGCCPHCGASDGYLNIGRQHWFYCVTHRVKWCIGDDLFSSWHYETSDIWQRNRDLLRTYTQINADAATDAVDWRAVDAIAEQLLAGLAL